jgi:hypothetical protein
MKFDTQTALMAAAGLFVISWLFDFRDIPVVGNLDIIDRSGSSGLF